MGDYREIDGKRLDGVLVSAAERLVSGRGDGRLSREDAESLMAHVRDAGLYTEVERDTVAYIRSAFEWSEAAADWFDTQVGKFSATRSRG